MKKFLLLLFLSIDVFALDSQEKTRHNMQSARLLDCIQQGTDFILSQVLIEKNKGKDSIILDITNERYGRGLCLHMVEKKLKKMNFKTNLDTNNHPFDNLTTILHLRW